MIVSRVAQAVAGRYRKYQDRLFDYRYGLDTRQDRVDYVARMPAASAEWAIPYEPIQAFMFRRILAELHVDRRDYAFVDLGSGKGRAVLLASSYGFAKVIGVELSTELHAIAQQNVRSFTSRARSVSPIELVCGDARTYELPRRNLIVFLYNPFIGEVLEDVATRLERFVSAEPADLWLLYRNPQCADRMARIPGLIQHAESRSYRIYRRSA
jgi:SAM-dependent methyltransferase